MKKMLITVGLFFASSAIAMEPVTLTLLTFSPDETNAFKRHFSMAVGACKRKTAEKIYPENNSVCTILCQLSEDLGKHDNDIKHMINADQDLSNAINSYRSIDFDPVIQRALDQVRKDEGDVKKAKELVIQNRRVLSELKLKTLQPAYSLSLIGEIDTKERENFVHRNEHYPMNAEAVKQYKALFIYLTLFADKVV